MNLKELAKTLDLSQTTVSRALGGYPEVSAKTRARVKAAAQEHNYRPNARAFGLATGRSMMIGHVIPPASTHEMVNPIFGDFIAGAAEAASAHHYSMMFARVQGADEAEMYRSLKSNGVVDGVILQGPSINDERIALLREIGLPFVVHGRSTDARADYSWVDVNNTRAFARATEFLLQLGHRRIALVNGLEDMDFALRRRSGYEQALQAAHVSPDPELMCSAEMTETYGFESATQMLNTSSPPTAIIAASMISAIGVRRAIAEAGLRLGQDVSVITHDDDLSYLRNGDDVPIFTATRSSVRLAGEIVVDFLIDQISDPAAPAQHRLLEAELLVGASTGPAPS